MIELGQGPLSSKIGKHGGTKIPICLEKGYM